MNLRSSKILYPAVSALLLAACDPLAQDPKYQLDLEREYEDTQVRELAHAAAIARLARIEKLVADGVDVNAIGDRKGYTPLMWALNNEQTSSTETLLKLGANPNIIVRGNSAMGMAIQNNDSRSLGLMLTYGGDPNLGKDNRSPLIFEAIENGNMVALRMLVVSGAKADARGPQSESSLIYAARHNNYEAAYFLLQHGADHKAVDRFNHTLMHYIEVQIYPPMAGVDYRAKVVEFLRDKGVQLTPWGTESDQ